MSMEQDLEDFAAKEKATRVPRCQTCALPRELREAIHENRKKAEPVPFRVVSAWLAKKGVDISHTTLSKHFKKGHAR